ncbi:MAG: aminopeptidase N [Thiotrichales bacterium]|nr:aminopeptidase N [Thiotrichales bacterium]
MSNQTPKVHLLNAYQPCAFSVESVYLQFDLRAEHTRVINRMQIHRLAPGALRLDGENLQLESIRLDGQEVMADCQLDETGLSLETEKHAFELEIVTWIHPEQNTALEGLYRTSGNYCTQCEAEGFRKITYYFDRPDVLSVFTTKIIADKAQNRFLLANGNLIESGEMEEGRHYAVWHDPFHKPCYLFALVAGNLEKMADTFTTADGREVLLEIYVEARNLEKCTHAMASLKRAMRWDEQRFGLIYDLDRYMIVAVDDFNMGAMENKGLNVFNSKFVLANPQTATDTDYEGIEAVIAHEYFHNWTGNRVTCRDWFQLTLKEGLTVFRDQEFTADMLSPAVKRIEDVKHLRAYQFPEDAGPMAHPIQPQSYIEMNNFYTMTVYEKGAEVVRLYQTLLGRDGFRKGMDLYFARHDGQAVTVQDFRQAMADANQVNLDQMHHWYVQSGTPLLQIESQYDSTAKTLTLRCRQSLPNAVDFQPMLLPIGFGLLSAAGEPLVLKPAAECAEQVLMRSSTDAILQMTLAEQNFVFTDLATAPIPSLLRQFSAPVKLEYAYTEAELALLAAADEDSFVRWEAMQTLLLQTIQNKVSALEQAHSYALPEQVLNSARQLLSDTQLDPALVAMALSLPDISYLAEHYVIVPIDALTQAHRWLQQALADALAEHWLKAYQRNQSAQVYAYDKVQIAQRLLKNCALGYLGCLSAQQEWVWAQYQAQQNMTDVLAALRVLLQNDHPLTEAALADFYQRWQGDNLVIDKWFALQAEAQSSSALSRVKALSQHADFTLKNPNRARSLLGVFARLNWQGFHQIEGEGYQFVAQQIMQLDALNPQIAARLLAPFSHWKRYDVQRQTMMQAALQQILQRPGVSKDVYEIAAKSLQ